MNFNKYMQDYSYDSYHHPTRRSDSSNYLRGINNIDYDNYHSDDYISYYDDPLNDSVEHKNEHGYESKEEINMEDEDDNYNELIKYLDDFGDWNPSAEKLEDYSDRFEQEENKHQIQISNPFRDYENLKNLLGLSRDPKYGFLGDPKSLLLEDILKNFDISEVSRDNILIYLYGAGWTPDELLDLSDSDINQLYLDNDPKLDTDMVNSFFEGVYDSAVARLTRIENSLIPGAPAAN